MQQSDQTQPQYSLEQELNKKRALLLKKLEQGEKIDNLVAAPEWEFFEGWLQASKQELITRVTSGAFIKDHEGYLFNIGAINTIDSIFKGINAFKRAFEQAKGQQIELDKEFDRLNDE